MPNQTDLGEEATGDHPFNGINVYLHIKTGFLIG
jgi:hypothetical protein